MTYYSNSYTTTLNGAITNVATSLIVTSATGKPVDVPFILRIDAEGANTAELVRVTAVAGTTYTIDRAVEPLNGVQAASAHGNGAVIKGVLTAATLPGGAGTAVGCKAYATVGTTVTNGTFTAITLGGEEYDTDGFHDNVTNNTRLTIPAGKTGYYVVSGSLEWDNNTSGERILTIFKNGSEVAFADRRTGLSGGGNTSSINTHLFLIAGDYIELQGYQSSGSNRTTSANQTRTWLGLLLDSGTGSVGQGIGVRATNTAATSITTATATAVPFATEDFDTSGFHDTVTNNTRLTIPAGLGGKYLITGQLTFASTVSNSEYAGIMKNGTTVMAFQGRFDASGNANGINVSTILDLVVGDYVELIINQSTGSSKTLEATVGYNWLAMMRLDSGGAGSGTLIVTDTDGSPSASVATLVFPSDSVTISGSTATIRQVPTAFIGCRAVSNATTSVSNATFTAVNLAGTESFDTDGFHDTSSNTSRFTIPAGLGGRYLFSMSLEWDSNTSGERILTWRKNGTGDIYIQRDNAKDSLTQTGSDIIDLVAGDYIEMAAYQNSGGSRTVGAANAMTHAELIKLDSGKVGQGIGASVYGSGTQTLVDNTDTALTFNTEDFDTDGFHDTGSNTDQMTIPVGLSGKYLITGRVSFAADADGFRQLYVDKNGVPASDVRQPANSGSNPTHMTISHVADLVVGDVIRLRAYHNAGNSLSTGAASGYTANRFQIMRLDSGSPGAGTVVVTDTDGSPSQSVGTIVFPADSVTISGSTATVRQVPSAFIGCKVYKASAQTISNNLTTDLTFDSELWDSDNFASSGVNSGRPTVPVGLGGKYRVSIHFEWAANSSGARLCYATLNGSPIDNSLASFLSASNGDRTITEVSADLDLPSGSIIGAAAYQNSGGNLAMTCKISLHKLDSGKVGQGIGCGVTNSVDIAITAGAEAVLNLDTNLWDTDGFHSTGSNTNRITVPAGLGGKYLLNFHARYTTSPGRAYLIARKQTANVISLMVPAINNGTDFVAVGSTVLDLAVGDYVELKYLTSNSVNIEATTVDYGPVITFMRLDSGSGTSTSSAVVSAASLVYAYTNFR